MRPILLIAANFLREQRWLTLVLVVYAIAMAAVFCLSEKQVSTENVLFFLRQQSLYAPLFSLFLGVSAIHNERKSRRIVTVMSKALARSQYIAGLLAGILAVVGIYCLVVAIAGTRLARGAQVSLGRIWILLAITAVVSVLVSAVAIFFSTFLAPVFATAATALVVAVPAVLERAVGHGWGNLLPVYTVLMQLSETTMSSTPVADWPAVAIAAIEALFFYGLASWIFAGRDITTAVE